MPLGLGIVLSEHTDEDGAAIFQQACKLGLEGIVSKRLSAPYRSGPSRDWLKIKNPDSRARQARELAGRALNDRFKADFVAAERRWMTLAHDYERQHQLSRTLGEFARRRKVRAIARIMREQDVAFART